MLACDFSDSGLKLDCDDEIIDRVSNSFKKTVRNASRSEPSMSVEESLEPD